MTRPPGPDHARRTRGGLHVDHERSIEAARERDCVIELIPPLGELRSGGRAARPREPGRRARRPGAGDRRDPSRSRAHDRPGSGLRPADAGGHRRAQRSPIAVPRPDDLRAGDRPDDDCLRQLVQRHFPDGRHHDAEGRLRLVEPTMEWEGFVALAFDEMIEAGRLSPRSRAGSPRPSKTSSTWRRPTAARRSRSGSAACASARNRTGSSPTRRASARGRTSSPPTPAADPAGAHPGGRAPPPAAGRAPRARRPPPAPAARSGRGAPPSRRSTDPGPRPLAKAQLRGDGLTRAGATSHGSRPSARSTASSSSAVGGSSR